VHSLTDCSTLSYYHMLCFTCSSSYNKDLKRRHSDGTGVTKNGKASDLAISKEPTDSTALKKRGPVAAVNTCGRPEREHSGRHMCGSCHSKFILHSHNAKVAELLAAGIEPPVNPKITACPHTTAYHKAKGCAGQ
jgi:hypothetical protein